ncbi:MAG: Uncharacterized protein G01um101416_644 [Microgenomates group bacterium Gr01-1014_16]|nr:MAG: Uncharacterized protein G01um101416_644 [Microgenomates group bacterium Gr01-1014_16]
MRRLAIAVVLILDIFFWWVFFRYIILDFSSALESARSISILFFPLATTAVLAILITKKFQPLLHLILVLFLANFGVIYTVYHTSRATFCVTATQIFADPRCLYLYNSSVYNLLSSGTPNLKPNKKHQGHPCQTTLSTTSGNIYDTTVQLNSSTYNFHLTSGYLTNTSKATNLGPLCATVTQVYDPATHLRFLSNPASTPTPTRTPTPIPTVTVTPSPIPGDANNDGKVDGIDYTAWLLNYFTYTQLGPAAGDFNHSGFVDGVDYTIWIANYSP